MIDSQKPNRREYKDNTKEYHQTSKIKTETEREMKKKFKINGKTRLKMAINTYL